jgi:Lipid II flippase MurJ
MGAAISRDPKQLRDARAADGAMRLKHAHAGLAMAVATFAMAATSGIQALLYLNSFGVDGRTDGFFAAFALYASFGVFSQSIRVTAAPLLVGRGARLSAREFAATLALIALPVAIATVPLAGPLAKVLAPGLGEAGRGVTTDALPLLGAAMVLQLWAAGAATVLAVRDRFRAVAAAYTLGAVIGLVTYVAVVDRAGELSLGWSMLAMAIVTFGVMLGGLRGSGEHEDRTDGSLALSRLVKNAGLILGRTGVYLAFNALYLITLAFTSGYEPGDATVLSYAYLYTSYLVAGTGFALGMSRIADMRRAALAQWQSLLRDTVPQGFRYSMLLIAPAMAALVASVAPLIGELLPGSFGPSEVESLRVFGALLAPWVVAALLVNLLLPTLFALGRARLVNALAVPLIATHLLATAVGGELFGVEGVVGASFVAPLGFAAVLLLAGAEDESAALARIFVADTLRFAVPAVACFGAGALLADTFADGLAAAVMAGVVGTVLYAPTLLIAAPRQARVLVGRLRPLAAES